MSVFQSLGGTWK